MHRITTFTLGAALALGAGSVQAQESVWAYFEGEDGLLQAGVVSQDGSQLIIKCDEAGDNSVFAAVSSPTNLAPPSQRPPARPVLLRFDDGPVHDVRWRYYPNTVIALNTRRESTLGFFLNRLVEADRLEVRLDPVGATEIRTSFAVTGAREAVLRVFESCGDSVNPLEG